jgi:cell division protein FtsL
MIALLTIMVSAFIAMMVYIMHLQKQKTAKQENIKDFDSIASA